MLHPAAVLLLIIFRSIKVSWRDCCSVVFATAFKAKAFGRVYLNLPEAFGSLVRARVYYM